MVYRQDPSGLWEGERAYSCESLRRGLWVAPGTLGFTLGLRGILRPGGEVPWLS